MNPNQKKALAVAVDGLREAFGDIDMLKWLEHPDSVRGLLGYAPLRAHHDRRANYPPNQPFDEVCADCETLRDEAHFSNCRIAEAWRAIGDPRGALDVQRAWAEAIQENQHHA